MMEVIKNDSIQINDLQKKLDIINSNLRRHYFKSNNINKLEDVRRTSNLSTAEHMTFAHF